VFDLLYQRSQTADPAGDLMCFIYAIYELAFLDVSLRYGQRGHGGASRGHRAVHLRCCRFQLRRRGRIGPSTDEEAELGPPTLATSLRFGTVPRALTEARSSLDTAEQTRKQRFKLPARWDDSWFGTRVAVSCCSYFSRHRVDRESRASNGGTR